MKTEENKIRAKIHLENCPNGEVTFVSVIPWIVQVLVFLLFRYINDD